MQRRKQEMNRHLHEIKKNNQMKQYVVFLIIQNQIVTT